MGYTKHLTHHGIYFYHTSCLAVQLRSYSVYLACPPSKILHFLYVRVNNSRRVALIPTVYLAALFAAYFAVLDSITPLCTE